MRKKSGLTLSFSRQTLLLRVSYLVVSLFRWSVSCLLVGWLVGCLVGTAANMAGSCEYIE
jgi:hypothetical protein